MPTPAPTPTRTITDAAALCLAARRQAQAFNHPAAPYKPRPAARRHRAWLGLAVVLLSAEGAAAVQGLGRKPPMEPAPAAVAPASVPFDKPPAPPRSPAPGAAGSIRFEAGEICIDITAMPLAEAARQLAAVTRTALDGAQALQAAGAGLTLKWRGRSAAAAWLQLLDGTANYAAWCGDHGCTVRVLGLWVPRAAGPSPAPLSAPLPEALQPDPPGLFPADG